MTLEHSAFVQIHRFGECYQAKCPSCGLFGPTTTRVNEVWIRGQLHRLLNGVTP